MGDVTFSHPRRVKAAAHASEFPPAAAAVVCSHLKCLECPRRSRRPNNCCHSENMFSFIYLFIFSPPPRHPCRWRCKENIVHLGGSFQKVKTLWEWMMGSRQRAICLVAAVYLPPNDECHPSSRPETTIAEEGFLFFSSSDWIPKEEHYGDIYIAGKRKRHTRASLAGRGPRHAIVGANAGLLWSCHVRRWYTKSHLLTMLRIRAAAVRWCSGHYATMWEFQKAFFVSGNVVVVFCSLTLFDKIRY